MPRRELVGLLRPARTRGVLVHGKLPGVGRRQQRVEQRPGGAQLVAAHEVLLVASDGVEQETLVGVGDVGSLWVGGCVCFFGIFEEKGGRERKKRE